LKTNAERQREFREKRQNRIEELETEVARLTALLESGGVVSRAEPHGGGKRGWARFAWTDALGDEGQLVCRDMATARECERYEHPEYDNYYLIPPAVVAALAQVGKWQLPLPAEEPEQQPEEEVAEEDRYRSWCRRKGLNPRANKSREAYANRGRR